jgi:hypothetical protein
MEQHDDAMLHDADATEFLVGLLFPEHAIPSSQPSTRALPRARSTDDEQANEQEPTDPTADEHDPEDDGFSLPQTEPAKKKSRARLSLIESYTWSAEDNRRFVAAFHGLPVNNRTATFILEAMQESNNNQPIKCAENGKVLTMVHVKTRLQKFRKAKGHPPAERPRGGKRKRPSALAHAHAPSGFQHNHSQVVHAVYAHPVSQPQPQPQPAPQPTPPPIHQPQQPQPQPQPHSLVSLEDKLERHRYIFHAVIEDFKSFSAEAPDELTEALSSLHYKYARLLDKNINKS